jgi:hypothetical protein
VIDDGGAVQRSPDAGRIGEVALDDVDARRQLLDPVPGDGADREPSTLELVDDGTPDRADPRDDMETGSGHVWFP